MDAFKTPIHTALSNSLTIQKEMASFTESQVKLAQHQVTAGFDAYRNAFAASQNASNAMAKVWLDAFKVEASA